MERDRTRTPHAEEVPEEEMDTSGHGDKLQDAVDRVAEPSKKQPAEPVKRVDEKDMDTSGHGDPKRDLLED